MSADEQKYRAAAEAAELVENGMTLGLGTGSTAAHLVRILGEKVRGGLEIRAIPTSEETRHQAREEGIALIDPDESTVVDLVIDGADECDGSLNLIKGGGGALLREKIVASAGTRMVVIADISKKVAQLGQFPLPVEIDRFAWPLTIQKIRAVLAVHEMAHVPLRLRPGRREEGGGVFVSDGGNYIADIECGRIFDAATLDVDLRSIPGVVETGLFIGLADLAIFGTDTGTQTVEGPAT